MISYFYVELKHLFYINVLNLNYTTPMISLNRITQVVGWTLIKLPSELQQIRLNTKWTERYRKR